MKRNTIEVIPSAADISVGKIDFSELKANGNSVVRLQAPNALAASVLLTLPSALPATAGEAVVSTVGGVLSFAPMVSSSVFSTAVEITTAGQGLEIKEGSNAKMGVATMVAGAVVVANTSVTAASRIFVTCQNYVAGGIGAVDVRDIIVGTSFKIMSTSNLDVRNVAWLIIEAL